MRRLNWMLPLVFILPAILTLPCLAGYQLREFETAGTRLYMSFDNASLAGYWKGQTPLADHEAQITTGALGNGCVAPELDVQLKGNINPEQGTITFFTRLNGSDKPLMQMLTADGQCMMQIGKVDSFLRPWVLPPGEHALGREADTHGLDHDNWVHLAMVWDQQKGVRFYINGKLASHQWGNFAYQDLRTPDTLKFLTQYGIDELWIFDHPLDGGQINALQMGRLIPASILAERIPTPRMWQAPDALEPPADGAPYRGTVPKWASTLRQLQTQTRQITGTPEPVRFDPHQVARLIKGHDLVYSSDKAISSDNQKLVNLWLWYTQAGSTDGSSPAPLLPQSQPGLAQQMMRSVDRGDYLPMHATMNMLATFLAEGDRRLLDAALTNALHDETACLPTLGLVSCRGQFTQRQLPDLSTIRQPAVTWENLGDDVVARVNRVSDTSLHVTMFNFNNQGRVIKLRPWSLSAGQYQLISGPDANDDDMVDQIALMAQWHNVDCGSSHTITLPSGQTVVELVQVQARKLPKALPDPAVDASLVQWDRGDDTLKIKVVNPSSVAAEEVIAELYADGLLLREERIDTLPPTRDVMGQHLIRYPQYSKLGAKTIQVRLRYAGREQSAHNNTLVCEPGLQ